MTQFKLVNPVLRGNFSDSFEASSPKKAAQMAWSNISSHILKNIPKFGFTLENTLDQSLHHFVVKESLDDNKVGFSIDNLDIKLSDSDLDSLKNKSSKLSGGFDSELDDLDDEDEIYNNLKSSYDSIKRKKHNTFQLDNSVISYVWYNPLIYRFGNIFIPTFVYPLSPYIELDFTVPHIIV